ncbi:DUF1295 domain-containing protein [Luteipulveratus flavus]|uniref:DUF1295 domain-containing protein n=1 Tax=Luteipulveratus flavus TaxID=3031728 RepID=A0ABT6C3P7_9MICO|nr:DUF1295 domain-containing protein [Luteipulveratus sp. YIM 133296]MDF8263583.1 DUF1295 domain-containing protein [Luteipulveratus sp. YIM 133296]
MRPPARIALRAAGVAAATQLAAYVTSRKAKRTNVVDVFWGPGLAAIAVASAAGRAPHSSRADPWLLAGGLSLWAGRLSQHVYRASQGRGEDPRYAEILRDTTELQRIGKVFLTQGLGQWFISLPVQAVAALPGPSGRAGRAVASLGYAAMVAGGVTEAVADAQKAAWKRRDDHGPVMDEGLWAWSRHPNYFGDALLWWGVYAVAAARDRGALTVGSPLAMTWFLTTATGARRTERMRGDDPDYARYQERVAFFVPRPPRNTPTAGGTS